MAKKDKFVYSTDYLAKIHAPASSEETTPKAPEAKPAVQGWDEKGKIKEDKSGKPGRPKKAKDEKTA